MHHAAARTLLALGMSLACAVPAPAQTAPAQPAAAPVCAARDESLGGIGRARVFTFTGPIYGGTICATVASVVGDAFVAHVAGAVPADALVASGVSGGGLVSLTFEPGGASLADAGPYVVAPGGSVPALSDTRELPRVVLAYSGARVLLIGTSAISLTELARTLRTQPGLFGSDAIERAVLIASGADAALLLRTAAGEIGTTPSTARVLAVVKRI